MVSSLSRDAQKGPLEPPRAAGEFSPGSSKRRQAPKSRPRISPLSPCLVFSPLSSSYTNPPLLGPSFPSFSLLFEELQGEIVARMTPLAAALFTLTCKQFHRCFYETATSSCAYGKPTAKMLLLAASEGDLHLFQVPLLFNLLPSIP